MCCKLLRGCIWKFRKEGSFIHLITRAMSLLRVKVEVVRLAIARGWSVHKSSSTANL